MKIQIRRGIFETNSSMTHSLTIVTAEQYNEWRDNPGVYFDEYDEKFYTKDELHHKMLNDKYFDKDAFDEDPDEYFEEYLEDKKCSTYDEYGREGLEQFSQSFTTPSGDKIVCFGQYGENY